MPKHTILTLMLLAGLLSCTPATDTASETTDMEVPEPTSATEKAIHQAVLDAYAVIGFEKGSAPDYDAIKVLFTPEATLYNFREDSLEFALINDFLTGFKGAIDGGAMLAFNEVELGGKTEYFGKVAHRISAYASYFDGSMEIGEKGVNSFQLLQIEDKWLINSIIWDVEKEGQVIPGKYLGTDH